MALRNTLVAPDLEKAVSIAYDGRYVGRYVHGMMELIDTVRMSYCKLHVGRYVSRCMHTFTHTYIHTYMHTYIHTYLHTYMHTYIHIGDRAKYRVVTLNGQMIDTSGAMSGGGKVGR